MNKKMKPQRPALTMRELWEFAKAHHLQNATIRVCDGMAVSYYLEPQCMANSPHTLVLDVSTLQPVEYDELPDCDKRVIYY